MKIAFINSLPEETGGGRCAFNLYKRLQGNYDIEQIFLSYTDRSIERIGESSRQTITKVRSIPLIDNKPFFWYRLKGLIPRYDLYHLTNQNLSFLLNKSRILKSKLCIITCLDIIRHTYPQNRFDYLIGRYLYQGLKQADKLIAISEYTKGDLTKYLKISEDKITVVHQGVDHEKYKPMPKDDEIVNKYKLPEDMKIILYVGAEYPRKNLPTLIEAFGKLKKDYEGVKLVKAGNPQTGGAREKLIKLINKLGLENEIIFTDFVPEEDLPKLYNAADLFVFPSFYEGFGLPPLEAMACGTPVITSNASSLPEVVGDAGIMVDPHDVVGLAKAMYDVLTNDPLRENLVKKGLQRAKLFNWEKTARETLKVYEEVISTTGKRK